MRALISSDWQDAPKLTVATAADLELPLLWTATAQTLLQTAPTPADVDGDGYAEVVAVGREEVLALDRNGKHLWRYHTPSRCMTYPAILQRKGQPSLIYAVDTGGELAA